MPSSSLEPGVDPERVVREANARLQDHQRIRTISVWPGTRAAAHRRHAQAETGGHSRLGERRRAAAGGAAGRHARGVDWHGSRAAAQVSGATTLEELGLTLPRTRRADGRARGPVPDADRRGALLRGGQHRRSASSSSKRLRPPRPRRSRSTFPTWNRSRPVRIDPPAVARDMDRAADPPVRARARRGLVESARRSTGRSCSRRITRATWTCR